MGIHSPPGYISETSAVKQDQATIRSREALEHLYRANLSTVYRFCTSRLGRAHGEEVAAEVFVAAAIAFRDGVGDQITTAWLMTTARNKVIDQWRKAGRRKAKAHLINGSRRDLIDFPTDWATTEVTACVVSALERCSDRHRTALIAHYVDGLPATELAEVMSISLTATESLLARARHAFQKHYASLTEVS